MINPVEGIATSIPVEAATDNSSVQRYLRDKITAYRRIARGLVSGSIESGQAAEWLNRLEAASPEYLQTALSEIPIPEMAPK